MIRLRKLALLGIALFCVGNVLGQINMADSTVQVIGYWKNNEKESYTITFEKYKIIPDVGIQFLNFHDGLLKFPVNADVLKRTKKLVLDIHNKIKSDNIKDYPCTCGGYCEKDIIKD